MGSFSELYRSFDADPAKRGGQFERFVKWFLTTDPEWSTQVDQIWLWNDYPGRWGRDCGVDLVFKHKSGQTWAVQAKCYSPHYEITKTDIDKFLSETNRKSIDHRLLIATTDRIGANARQVCNAQEKSVVRYLRTQFDTAALDYPDNISRLITGKRKPLPEPRPHQIEAIDSVTKGFETTDRGQLIMACGTGKTLVSLWVKERLDAQRTLVLVPSLSLLSQIVNDWTSSTQKPFDALCVCSDETAGKRQVDEAITTVSDLAFPVTSDVSEITRFLSGNGRRVVFSTYQSSPLVEEAQRGRAVPEFDFVVADEAHRCAGKIEGAFATVLDDRKIRATKRLFATATPRTYSTSIKKGAEALGVEVVDMADEAAFGKRLHTLPFGEAIKRGLLTDYRVVIVGVDDETIANWIRDRLLVGTGTGIETDAASLAAEIGLLKAIKDYNLQRIITFHNRVKRAEEFANELVDVAGWSNESHIADRRMWCEHVSGEMPTFARTEKLRRLKAVGKSEIGLLSNARCLSEGVDVPSLDCVAFIDAKSSQLDIIQAVGRAIRLSGEKKTGTIVIPVFIERHQDAERAIESSNFKPIWDVLDALKAHDDVFSDQLDQLRIELGAGRKSKVGEQDLTKIVFDLPTSVDVSFAQSLRVQLVEKTTESWMFRYGLLEAYVKEHGHCRVPRGYKTSDGFSLDLWIGNQRAFNKRGELSAERKAWLDAIGFDWDPLTTQWQEGFAHLESIVKEHGHSRVPSTFIAANGFKLGRWVIKLRTKNETLPPERKARLDALGFDWDPLTSKWEEGFTHLEAFVKEHGHCRVPQAYKTADGFRLGQWVGVQRSVKGTIPNDRRARLAALAFVWDPYDTDWEEGFSHLEAFVKEHGHCRVPRSHKNADGFRLGQWVGVQRSQKDAIRAERKARLDALGFEWDPLPAQWEEGFAHLEAFVKEHGHCRVPPTFMTAEGYNLGRWIIKLRTKNETLLPERKARLDALGIVWDARIEKWEEGFSHLEAFVKEHGHCRVPDKYQTADRFQLGIWVSTQRTRQRRSMLLPERKARLDALGFVWSTLDAQWEKGFAHLEAFVKEYGHCRVSRGYRSSDGFTLDMWVVGQRSTKEKLSGERKARLDALGFDWDPLTSKWEEGFPHLEAFVKEHGHCRVPQAYKTADGFKLGTWVGNRRMDQRKGKLSPERRARLDALGFVWSVMTKDTPQRKILCH